MAHMPNKTKKGIEPGTTAIKIEVGPDTPAYYVNYMTVSHTPFDLVISVTRLPSPPSDEQIEIAKKGQPVPIDATLQLIVPPLVARGLVRALADQLQKYDKTLALQVEKDGRS
jgi:hypothetical protein